MAQIKGKLRFSDGTTVFFGIGVCFSVLLRLVDQVLSDLNRHGAQKSFGPKEHLTAYDLVTQYYDTGAFQRFIESQGSFSIQVLQTQFVRKVFQEFDLVSRKAKKEGKVELDIPKGCEWKKIEQALWTRGYAVISSEETVEGWPVKVLVGTHIGYPHLDSQLLATFLNLSGGKNSPYKQGALYSEDLSLSLPSLNTL